MPVSNEQWDRLNEKIEKIEDIRGFAQEKISHLSTEQVFKLRRRAKTDLYFLATGILGYNKLSENLHGDLCNWLARTEMDQFREVLLPRGHYKSTIVTISHCIQIALTDDVGDQPWPMNLGTNSRTLISHETQESAAGFLFSITQHFTTNVLLMGLFPECVPDPKKHRINKGELDLPRSQIWSEPTFGTMGVGARSQGKHYNYIKCDDLIGDKARDSKVEMQAAKDWFDNIQSFFSTFKDDKLDVIGTRWAVDDLYAHIQQNYGNKLKIYSRSVEEFNPKTKRKESIFPEEFPLERLSILRKNKKVFNAQYLNDPKEGNAEFEESWKKYYFWQELDPFKPYTGKLFIPGKVIRDNEIISLRDCEKLIFVDPAMDGPSGIIVTATDWRQNYRVFILEAIEKAYEKGGLTSAIFTLVNKWQPRLVSIEEQVFSKLLIDLVKIEMVQKHTYFRVVGTKTQQKSKESRVRALSTWFTDGRIYFNDSKMEQLLYEFDNFGAISDYHALDALAQGIHHWRPSKRFDEMNMDEQRLNARQQMQDIATGYSQIEYGEVA